MKINIAEAMSLYEGGAAEGPSNDTDHRIKSNLDCLRLRAGVFRHRKFLATTMRMASLDGTWSMSHRSRHGNRDSRSKYPARLLPDLDRPDAGRGRIYRRSRRHDGVPGTDSDRVAACDHAVSAGVAGAAAVGDGFGAGRTGTGDLRGRSDEK